jgi:hypothetical protein
MSAASQICLFSRKFFRSGIKNRRSNLGLLDKHVVEEMIDQPHVQHVVITWKQSKQCPKLKISVSNTDQHNSGLSGSRLGLRGPEANPGKPK